MFIKVHLSGLSCHACQKMTENRFRKIKDVENVIVFLKDQTAEISSSRDIALDEFQDSLKGTDYKVIKII